MIMARIVAVEARTMRSRILRDRCVPAPDADRS